MNSLGWIQPFSKMKESSTEYITSSRIIIRTPQWWVSCLNISLQLFPTYSSPNSGLSGWCLLRRHGRLFRRNNTGRSNINNNYVVQRFIAGRLVFLRKLHSFRQRDDVDIWWRNRRFSQPTPTLSDRLVSGNLCSEQNIKNIFLRFASSEGTSMDSEGNMIYSPPFIKKLTV